MKSPEPQTVTRLLRGARDGEAGAAETLIPLVYDQLHHIASSMFSSERRGHTLQPTALIHEAWVKLSDGLDGLENRRHFFVIASRAMRQVLADHARSGRRLKRGDGRKRVTLEGKFSANDTGTIDLVDLDDSLNRLAALNARHAQVVELRILGGLTIAEAAAAIGVSHTTVEGDWFTAKAWLRKELASA